MPRSSGGGSHSSGYSSSSGSSRSSSSGGGSHSSGYHSSSSYSSSRSSYSGSSRSSYSSSHRSSFSSGPRKTRHSQPVHHSSYTAYPPSSTTTWISSSPRPKPETHLLRLIFWIPILFLVLTAGLEVAFEHRELNKDYDHTIVIEDNIGVIRDRDRLQDSLNAFFDTTGISPSVVTLHHEDWEPYYNHLENKAFDIYVNRFQDERHWLIVYSVPTVPDPAFNDWLWEGIQGDDTVNILTESVCDAFGQKLQKYLTAETRYSVDEALCLAFDETTERLGGIDPDWPFGIIALLIIMVPLLRFVNRRTGVMIALRGLRESKSSIPVKAMDGILPTQQASGSNKTINDVEVPPKHFAAADEVACPYCGSLFKVSLMSCPNCGAARRK